MEINSQYMALTNLAIGVWAISIGAAQILFWPDRRAEGWRAVAAGELNIIVGMGILWSKERREGRNEWNLLPRTVRSAPVPPRREVT